MGGGAADELADVFGRGVAGVVAATDDEDVGV